MYLNFIFGQGSISFTQCKKIRRVRTAQVHGEQTELSPGFTQHNTLEKILPIGFFYSLKQFLVEKDCIQDHSCTEIPSVYQTVLLDIPNGCKKTSLNKL